MAKSSGLRKQKLYAKKELKKKLQPLRGGSPSPTNPLEVPHLRRLEADLEQLGTAFNHNATLYGHALTIAEMRLRVLERAMNDQLGGTVRTIEVDGQKRVDFESYNNELIFCMLMAEFAQWAVKLMDKHAERTALIYNPGSNDDEPVIFGGGP
jgi:hypothetical protein